MTPIVGDVLSPVIIYPVQYALDRDEWALIQRLRQIRREGNGEKLLVDPRAKTLQIVSGRVEKL